VLSPPDRSVPGFEGAFAKLIELGAGGLVIGRDALFVSHSEKLAALAAHHGGASNLAGYTKCVNQEAPTLSNRAALLLHCEFSWRALSFPPAEAPRCWWGDMHQAPGRSAQSAQLPSITGSKMLGDPSGHGRCKRNCAVGGGE
jgi:hypothetical protein